ncbi:MULTISPECIES: BT4734/BF3469 family protein [Olivibacter]|uniref:BT4734/BF3469 family protein n=1 Tax=Olivibacter jilunii TaxID=985016 RepID=A0ABW6AV43_9SPHI
MNKTLLQSQCSLFRPYEIQGQWAMGTTPNVVNFVDVLTKPAQTELIAKIRSLPYKSDEQKALKKQLLAITPSSIQVGGRGSDFHESHTGFMAFDIDNIEGKIISTFDLISRIPYVQYLARSASGNGLWGLMKISDTDKHKEHFDAMESSFLRMGIKIDPAPSNVASIRFLAFDEDAYFNESALTFDKLIKAPETSKKSLKTNGSKSFSTSDGRMLIEWFNRNVDESTIDTILVNYGFTFHSRKGDRIRYTRPDKAVRAGLSVDYHVDRRTLFAFSSETPCIEHFKKDNGGWSASPITLLLHYYCGGNGKDGWRKAFETIKSLQ